MSDIVKSLLDQKLRSAEAMKAFATEVEARDEDKRWTEEDNAKFTKMNEDYTAIKTRCDELYEANVDSKKADEQRAEWEKVIHAQPEQPKTTEPTDEERLVTWVKSFASDKEWTPKGVNIRMSGEDYRRVAAGFETRTQSKLTAAAGGNIVPTTFRDTLYEHLIENSTIRQVGATVITTDSGEAMIFPKTTAHGGAALVAEAGVIPASDATFGQVTLDAFKYGKLTQVSNELVTDSPVNLLDYLARDTGRAIGNASGAHFVSGTGTGQPNGIFTAAATGVTGPVGTSTSLGTQGTANQGADALLNLIYSVTSPYRGKGKFLTNDGSIKSVRTLKDTTGQYIWQSGTIGGAPDSIFGYPVFTDPNVPVMAASAKSWAFGDFSAYLIRDVAGLRYERSDDFAFNQDLISFRGLLRTDGDLLDAAAIKLWVNAAT